MADSNVPESQLLNELNSFPKDIPLSFAKKSEIKQNIMDHIHKPIHNGRWKKVTISFIGIVAICIFGLLTLTFIKSDVPQEISQANVQKQSLLSKTDVIDALEKQGIPLTKAQSPKYQFYILIGQTPDSYIFGKGSANLLIYRFQTPEEVQQALKQFNKQTQTMNLAMHFFTVKNMLLFYTWGSSEKAYLSNVVKAINDIEPVNMTANNALLKVLDKNPEFPKFKLGQEVNTTDVPTGGPEGSTTTITYSAQVTGDEAEGYMVTLKKDWHLNVNGTPVISTSTWAVTAENITLMSSLDNDNLANEIK